MGQFVAGSSALLILSFYAAPRYGGRFCCKDSPTLGDKLLAAGYLLLVTGYWQLIIGYYLLAIDNWLLATDH